jgi:hypothetical protein
MMQENEYVVVGTSFSALSACMYLVSLGLKPLVIDSNLNKSDKNIDRFVKPSLKRPLGLKNQLHYPNVYVFPKSRAMKYSSNHLFGPTFCTGGYSEVWGNVVDDSIDLLKSFLKIPVNEISEITYFIKSWMQLGETDNFRGDDSKFKKINSYNSDIEIKMSKFALKTSIFSSSNLEIHETDKNSNFNTLDLIEYLADKGLIDLWKGYLLNRIEKDSDNKTTLYLSNESDQLVTKAANLYLGTGVASTAQILLASKIINSAIIKDSQLTLVPFLKFGNALKRSIAHQNYTRPKFILKNVNQDEGNFYVQVYNLDKELFQRFDKTKLKFLLKVLKPIILKYIGVMFCYLNEDDSGSLCMTYNKDEYRLNDHRNNFDKKRFNHKFKVFTKILIELGYLPFTYFKRVMHPGDGFHVGHLQGKFPESINEVDVTESNGSLKGFKGVYLIDGSSLNFISAGPITLAIMINSIRIVKQSTLGFISIKSIGENRE